jgi:glycosyltransferase involved in cell wall biosynthesis
MSLTKSNIEFLKDKKPKIAIIAPPLDSVPSIAGNAIYTMVEDIAKNSKHSIIVFSAINTSGLISSISDQIIYIDVNSKLSIVNKILGYRLSKLILNSNNFKHWSYYNKVYKIAKKNKIEVVLQEEFSDLLFYIQSGKINIILHQHAVCNEVKWKRVQNKIKEIVFVSNRSKDEDNYSYQGIIKTRRIYNGINSENFQKKQYADKQTANNLLYVGRITTEKGIIELIKAVQKLDNITLKIIGDVNSLGSTPEFRNQLMTEIAASNSVTLVGIKKQNELAEFYNWADFLICPSIGNEGLPKTITEGAVVGLPIIASNRGGVKEIVKNGLNGVIIEEPINEFNIKQAILCAIENYTILVENADNFSSEYANKFSNKTMVEKFDDIFDLYLSK